jgi:hypothetical protein
MAKFARIKDLFEIGSLHGRRLCVEFLKKTPYGRFYGAADGLHKRSPPVTGAAAFSGRRFCVELLVDDLRSLTWSGGRSA